MNFWDSNVWSSLLLVAVLFIGMIFAFFLKRKVPFMRKSLIPASVLGGLIILVFVTIYQIVSKGQIFFDLPIFQGQYSGSVTLEVITYHCLGIGFVAMGLRNNDKSKAKVKAGEVFDTGITTVSTYLLQALLGIIITILLAPKIAGLIEGSGILLAFGFGQGTGQALNFGSAFMNQGGDYFLANGDHFGLSIAALGFLSASIGGVIYLNYLRRKGRLVQREEQQNLTVDKFQGPGEMEVTESIDKFTVQIAMVVMIYVASYFLMQGLSSLVGMKPTIFGFNFLLGTLLAVLVKMLLNFFHKKGLMKRIYINNFMLNRIAGLAFDVMIVAGIAAINLQFIRDYWYILIILGVVGALATFAFIKIVSHVLFKKYEHEQFFAMYGMLTGTASTGIILLREIDPNFETPASDNLVYQNLPAIVFGFPMMLLANLAPQSREKAILTMIILCGFLLVMLILLFRRQIFRRKKKEAEPVEAEVQQE